MMCRIGKGVSYCDGVSPIGKDYYDRILLIIGDKYAPSAIAILTHYEIQRKLENSICRTQAKLALQTIKQNVVNDRINECLDYLIEKIETTEKCVFSSEFKELSKGYIDW